MDRLKIALIGTGNRGRTVYLPIIRALSDDVELVAVCDERQESVESAGAEYGVPAFTDLETMVAQAKPDVCAVVITPSNNHKVGVPLSEMGVSYVTETPLDTDLTRCDEMIAAAERNGTKIEVAENYYRVPTERIKRSMILAGVFGRVLSAYNDFRGHGYHGVGLIRSYIGLDVAAARVFGFTRSFGVQEHHYRGGTHTNENWQHGVIEFENGSVGVFNFSSLSYGSPLRRYNTSKFFGERGLCIGDEPAILNAEANDRHPIIVKRRTDVVDGEEVLASLTANTSPPVVWENPLRGYKLSDGQLSVASEIMSIVTAVREDTEPEYGYLNGRIDREIDLAMSRSWQSGGQAVELPLSV
ncbi:Gfo/Idh/MocA family oxidoreductase [Candidatus Poribacteria bacterium]|nr:Gfo/Idh/MocA family oxidoreductase [Candidatus Poribacteria bacterium]